MKLPKILDRSAMLRVRGSRGVVLLLAAAAMFVTAAFLWHMIAGFAVAGVALLYLENRFKE